MLKHRLLMPLLLKKLVVFGFKNGLGLNNRKMVDLKHDIDDVKVALDGEAYSLIVITISLGGIASSGLSALGAIVIFFIILVTIINLFTIIIFLTSGSGGLRDGSRRLRHGHPSGGEGIHHVVPSSLVEVNGSNDIGDDDMNLLLDDLVRLFLFFTLGVKAGLEAVLSGLVGLLIIAQIELLRNFSLKKLLKHVLKFILDISFVHLLGVLLLFLVTVALAKTMRAKSFGSDMA